jgi:pyruvate dehydrogenase E2 component (dihydrolipoamide acetyltransferase)
MPKWGLTMKEGKITSWLVKEGDAVQKGQDLFEVETEKITNIVESTATGILFQIVVPAGTVVATGTIVAVITEPGEQAERIKGIQMGEAEEAAPARTAASAKKPEREPGKGFVLASPAARRAAKELGVDLGLVSASGLGGRVTEKDVRKFHEEGPQLPKITPLALEMARQVGLDIHTLTGTGEDGKITKADVERALAKKEEPQETAPPKVIPFAGMRKTVADNMHASLQNAAQLTAFVEVDVTEMVRFLTLIREEYKRDESVRISYNDIIILAVSRALKRFPIMNSTLVGDEILLHDSVNMGIAVALKEGLIVPVLRDADKKGLLQIAKEARILAAKAREGNLSVDEVTEGTFTISNVSMFQVDGLTPILKPPETGILGIGRVKEKPAVFQGGITIRSMMFLSLTFDHRIVDGAPANAFLETAGRYLEHPYLIMS